MGVQPDQSLPSGASSSTATAAAAEYTPASGSASRKRKKPAASSAASASASTSAFITARIDGHGPPETKRPKTEEEEAAPELEEKRLRRFRPSPPQSFYDIYDRATSQRFFVLGRSRAGTEDCPEETVELAGTTGNIYTVHIAQQPSCSCPHARQGNQCKHWLYVMSRVLRARFDLVYQLALLSSELREIFATAPPPIDNTSASPGQSDDKNRKPVEGDCPICFDELSTSENGDGDSERIVWCRAACGQNMHKLCFQMWSATKRQQAAGAAQVTCPFCRSPWEGDDDVVRNINKKGPLNDDGYVNIADQLGISPRRDYSSYSNWWDRPGYSRRSRHYYYHSYD